MYPLHFARAGAAMAALALVGQAPAADPPLALPAAPAPAAASSALGLPASPAVLAQARGGAAVNNNTVLGGTVSGNGATHVVTGSNSIQGGSFAGMSGLPLVVQNSGANVLIQNATVINLQLK